MVAPAGSGKGERHKVCSNEAAANAVEHGGDHGAVRTWTDSAWLVIEVISPAGQIIDPFAGYLPPDPHSTRGRGMWLIRQFTDVVESHNENPGVTVHMHVLT